MADFPRAPIFTRRWERTRVQDQPPQSMLALFTFVPGTPIAPGAALLAQPRARLTQPAGITQNPIALNSGLFRPSDNPPPNPRRAVYYQAPQPYANIALGGAPVDTTPPFVPYIAVNPTRRPYQAPALAYTNLALSLGAPKMTQFLWANPVLRKWAPPQQPYPNLLTTTLAPAPPPPTVYSAQRRYLKPRAWLWGLNG